MSPLTWRVIVAVAKALPSREREAILGDLAELHLSAGEAVVDVASIMVGRLGRSIVRAARVLILAVIYVTVIVALGDWFGLHVTTAE